MGDKVNKKLKLVEETLEALIKNSNLVYCVKFLILILQYILIVDYFVDSWS